MNRQTILLIVFFLALAGTAYVWISNISSQKSEESEAPPGEFESRLFELRRLKDINLDTSILEDPFFQSLNRPQEIPPPSVDIGRDNPFQSQKGGVLP